MWLCHVTSHDGIQKIHKMDLIENRFSSMEDAWPS